MIVVTIVTALHFPVGCFKIILTGLKVSLPVALDLTLAKRLTDPPACVGSQVVGRVTTISDVDGNSVLT